MNCRYLLFEMPGPGVRWLLAIVLLIGSSGIAAGCGPVTAAHTLEVLPKTLPPTWTEVPPSAISDTILEADITPSPTLGLATPIPPSPTSGPAVPFKYLYMFDSQRAWAWGWEEDITFLWRTDDGGSTWNEVTPVGIQRLVFALNADTVWVVTCQYAYEKCVLQSTDDGGKTWTELTKDEALLFNTQFTFFNPELGLIRNSDVAAGSAYIRFYQTFDGGMTWDKVQLASLPKGITKGLMDEFIICNCGDVLYIDLEQVIHIPGNLVKDPEREVTLFITKDRGQSWYKTTLSLPVGKYNTGWINPLNPAFFSQEEGILPVMISAAEDYTQSALVFYCTEDGGKNWSMLSMVEDVGRVSWELTLKIVSEQDIFFVCVTDLCVSHDGAKSWQRLSSNLDFGNPDQLSYVQQFSFGDPATGLALVEGIDDTISLWRTEDGGLSWQALSPQIVPKEN